MINHNNMQMNIRKSYYNKSRVQEDGITHIIDTSVDYPVYNFSLSKNYFDIDDKATVVREILNDLKSIEAVLEKALIMNNDKEIDTI